MADLALRPRAILAGRPAPARPEGPPGVTLTERPAGRLFTVLARRGSIGALAERCRGFGVLLPTGPQRVEGRGFGAIWTAPGQWLIDAEEREADRLVRLFGSFDSLCSTVAVDDGRLIVTVAGPKAGETLAKMVTIDLHPRAFGPGSAAVTIAGGMSVILWQIDDAPSFACAVPRSYAGSFWEWLVKSAAEYGVAATLVESGGGGLL